MLERILQSMCVRAILVRYPLLPGLQLLLTTTTQRTTTTSQITLDNHQREMQFAVV